MNDLRRPARHFQRDSGSSLPEAGNADEALPKGGKGRLQKTIAIFESETYHFIIPEKQTPK
jgi:hypothetical protein